MNALQYNPNALYEQNAPKGGVCPIKTVCIILAAATLNQLVIAAIPATPTTPAKRLFVLSGVIYSELIGVVNFKSASGGTALQGFVIPVNTAATPNVILVFNPIGHFETNTGEGLYADTIGASAIQVSLRYIEYTP